jgi:uncharacterized protein YfkK (UPF0435 family)
MDLSSSNQENAEFMIEEIKKKLKMASAAAFKATHFNMDMYEDLKDLYDMVMSKNNFSISEIEAITMELGRFRKA